MKTLLIFVLSLSLLTASAQTGSYHITKKIPIPGQRGWDITVIHQESPDKYSVVESVKTVPRAKTMALDPKAHQLFLSTAEAGQFEVLVVGR